MNPFDPALLRALARTHGTPLWVYDAATIRSRIAELRGFDTIRYAQKANSNTHLQRTIRVISLNLRPIHFFKAKYGKNK